MLNMKRIIKITLLLCIVALLVSSCTGKDLAIENLVGNKIIHDIYTDKSRYMPGDTAEITIKLKSEVDETGEVYLIVKYLGDEIFKQEKKIYLESGKDLVVNFFYETTKADYKGYSIEAWYKGNNTLDMLATAIDVSSDWNKFPRYGYLVEFEKSDIADLATIIDDLNKYHINGLQFYDWQYKHQKPLAGSIEEPSEQWTEIAKRDVYKYIIDDYIALAHDKNMMAMNYNLLFGVYEDYIEDGIKDEWGLYKMPKGIGLDYHSLPSSWATSKLFLMNPANDEWQNFIIEAEKDVFQVFDFDGWHVDQLGDRGTRYDFEGNSINLPESYESFLRKAAEEMDTRFVFNAVSEFAQLSLAKTKVDFLYAELWNSHSRYVDLKSAVDRGVAFSDGEKNIVLAAYMNYDMADFPGTFNTPGVLLTDAVIFASGGAHIELGDTGMLSKEYFPNDNLKMDDELKTALIEYYDFLVANQNILRDGASKITREVTSEEFKMTIRGTKDQIWYFAKETEDFEILHLINLIGNDEKWRDTNGKKIEPVIIENITLKYYKEEEINSVVLASPDINQGLYKPLEFETGSDEQGDYIQIIIPSLKYWNMILLKK